MIRAEGEARSIKLVGESIAQNPAYIELKKLDAAREIAHTVARSANRAYLSADALLLNVGSEYGVNERMEKEAVKRGTSK